MLRHGERPQARRLFDEVLDGIEANLQGWERKGWSLYELHPGPLGAAPNFNTPDYQSVHAALLTPLGRRSGRPSLEAAGRHLELVLASPIRRLAALYGKTRYRLREG